MPCSALLVENLAVIRVRGPQAADLLQAQTSQDVQQWDGQSVRLAALCNPQGRMLADFRIVRPSGEEFWLLLDASIAAQTLQRLRMFVLRLKCTLDDATGAIARWGLLGAAGCELPPALGVSWPAADWGVTRAGAVTLIRLPQPYGQQRALCLIERETADASQEAALQALPPLLPDEWALQDIRAGLPHISAATQTAFVPQMINFELIGGVNFKKGCYPGQEVVARSQYRGTLKRRMARLVAACAMQPGQEVFHTADPGQPCGLVVAAAAAGAGQWEALAELKLSAMEDPQGLRLGAADGASLQLAPLPYAALEPH